MSRHQSITFHHGALLLTVLAVAGCNNTAPPAASSSPQTSAADVHDHPTEGPHHGDLVELGNEEYHAEIVHGDGGEVTVYVLDSKAATSVPITATEVTINLSHDGQAEQFKLPAVRDASDPEGQSSRFTLKDEELAGDLDAEGTNAKLVIVIDGKSYSGKIEHHHEGEGHDHAHGEGENK